jgi:hypothetical protein
VVGRCEDRLDVEVGAHGVAGLPDLVRLVGLDAVQRVAILAGVDGDRPQPQLRGGAERPDRDLTTVGDEYRSHATSNRRSWSR